MPEKIDIEKEANGSADALAAVAIIALIVFTASFWLAGMPS